MSEEQVDLKTHIALLEKDVAQMNVFVSKMDSAIDKLADISSSIRELLIVHDHKLSQQSQVNDDLFDLINDLKDQNHNEHLETKKTIEELSHRIDNLEKWKYTVVGGAIVVGFLLSHIEKLFS